MNVSVIGFIPPVVGLEGEFNTFRLGSVLYKRLEVGDKVFLMNEKTKTVFGVAEVLRLENGELGPMCEEHARTNHLEVCNAEPGAPTRLMTFIQKVYGPHIATPTKKTTVIFLKRVEDGKTNVFERHATVR